MTTRKPVICADCGETCVAAPDSIGTGYARTRDNATICYACAGAREERDMIETGRATLYATGATGAYGACEITNWPGTLRFFTRYSRGRHNMARVRYDGRFTGPDGAVWAWTQYGDNTQIAHCRRVKTRA